MTRKVKELIEKEIEVNEILIYPLGPTITSHTGIGCIAVFLLVKIKIEKSFLMTSIFNNLN